MKKVDYIEFYRVEKDGLGPYIYEQENEMDYWMEYDHHDCEYTPPIHSDKGFNSEDRMIYDLNSRKKDALSGFSSMSQLENWFYSKELEKLKKLGFEIKKYKVKKIHDSGLQAFILKKYIL